MTSLTQTNIFDYSDLDAETRIIVQQRTSEIKSLMKRAASEADLQIPLLPPDAEVVHAE